MEKIIADINKSNLNFHRVPKSRNGEEKQKNAVKSHIIFEHLQQQQPQHQQKQQQQQQKQQQQQQQQQQ